MSDIGSQQVRELVVAHREQIMAIATSCGISNIRIFGSTLRSTGTVNDLDLLVTVEPGRSLLDFVAFRQDVSELLGIPVDLVSDKAISPYMRETILGEAVQV